MDILFLSKRIYLPDEESLVNGGILITNDGKIRKIFRSPDAINSFLYGSETESLIDFGEKVLMPGLIDPSVHINEPGRKDWEGFASATKSAAAGGFTTIADIPTNSTPPVTTVDNLKAKTALARGKLHVDVAFWGGLVPNNVNEIRNLIRAGVVGIKCFLFPSGDDDFPEVGENEIDAALKKMDGTGSVLAFHAEMVGAEKLIADEDHPKKYKSYLDTRPPSLETNAAKLITKLAKKYNLRTHISNLSSAECLPIITDCKKGGANLSVETCHHYLTLSAENIEDGHTEFKSAPPIREQANQDKLWQGIINKDVDLVVSNHISPTPGLRCLTYGRKRGDFLNAYCGIASLQFGLPVFWTKAQQYGLGLKDVYRLLCLNPAKLCGIDNIKGKFDEGYDADFCIWDPDEEFQVGPEIIRSQNTMVQRGCCNWNHLRSISERNENIQERIAFMLQWMIFEKRIKHGSRNVTLGMLANPYMGQKLRGTVYATVVRGLHVFQLYEGFGQPLGKVILRKTDRKIVKFE